MDTKKIVSWIALMGGEVIIIAAFILFRASLADNILVLNIVVSTIIYGLFFIDILITWINLGDKSQKKVGSLGLRWVFTWVYAILAIATMLVCNVAYDYSFSWQVIIHAILLFLLLFGIIGALTASDKVKEVYDKEEEIKQSEYRKRIEQIKSE